MHVRLEQHGTVTLYQLMEQLMEHFSGKDIFTVSCAVIGAVLGVINTWQGLSQRRVRLKIIPKMAYPVSHDGEFGPPRGCMEVTNLSTFPLTVREVGFTINGDPRHNERAPIIRPIIHDGGAWPRRLEPRSSVTVYFDWSRTSEIKKAYILTDCGEVAYGDSPALRTIRSHGVS